MSKNVVFVNPGGQDPNAYNQVQKYLQKKYGVEQSAKQWNPGTTRIPMFGWVICANDKGTKVVSEPEPCRFGTMEIPIEIQALADEKGGEEKGYLAIVSVHDKKGDLLKELQVRDEKKRKGFFASLFGRKKK